MDDLLVLQAFRADVAPISDERLREIRRGYRGEGPPARTKRRGWRLAGTAVAAAAVFAGVLATETLSGGGQTAAAAALTRAAARLELAPPITLAHGDYWYVSTRELSLNDVSYRINGEDRTASVLSNDVSESWIADDGSGGGYTVPGTPFALDDAGRQALAELSNAGGAKSDAQGIVEDGPNLIGAAIGDKEWSPDELAQVPTDESQLRGILDLPAGSSPQAIGFAEFEAISSALVAMPFDPQVTAKLYRVLASIPGIQDLGAARDALGRQGAEFAIVNGTSRWSLILDPSTGKLFERSESKVGSNSDDAQVPLGSLTGRQTIISTGVVDGLGVRPDGTRLDTSNWTVCKPDPQPGAPSQAHCDDPNP